MLPGGSQLLRARPNGVTARAGSRSILLSTYVDRVGPISLSEIYLRENEGLLVELESLKLKSDRIWVCRSTLYYFTLMKNKVVIQLLYLHYLDVLQKETPSTKQCEAKRLSNIFIESLLNMVRRQRNTNTRKLLL